MSRIEQIIENFRMIEDDFRLELLLDYAEKLPPLPEKYRSEEQIEAHRVHECQTPVSLWVEVVDGKVQIYADAGESPTVRGFLGVLTNAFNGLPTEEVLKAPTDILNRTGLAHTIGMTRTQGLGAILQRIKREVQEHAAT